MSRYDLITIVDNATREIYYTAGAWIKLRTRNADFRKSCSVIAGSEVSGIWRVGCFRFSKNARQSEERPPAQTLDATSNVSFMMCEHRRRGQCDLPTRAAAESADNNGRPPQRLPARLQHLASDCLFPPPT